MERSFQRHLRIMKTIGVELYLGPAGASAEEVDGAAFSNHVNRPLPRFWTANRFDHDITATLFGRDVTYSIHWIFDLRDLHDLVRSHALRSGDLGIALHHGNDVTTCRFGNLHKHQPDRP